MVTSFESALMSSSGVPVRSITPPSSASNNSVPVSCYHSAPPDTLDRIVNRTDLDPILVPYLQADAYAPDDIEMVVDTCQRSFPYASRTSLGQLIREWFRKRREYMTHRVYGYCNKNYRLREGGEVLEWLKHNVDELDAIRQGCNLDVTDVKAARYYAYDRVESFFNRRKNKKSPRE